MTERIKCKVELVYEVDVDQPIDWWYVFEKTGGFSPPKVLSVNVSKTDE